MTSDHRSHPDLLMAQTLGICWHSPTSDRWPCAQQEFTADELIRTARVMDAAGVPPDAGEGAVRAVALILRHQEGPPSVELPDWERELLRNCAACGCLMLSHGLGDGESGCRTDDCECDAFEPPERGNCGCDDDPIECNHEAAQGELLGIASEIETLGHGFGIAAAGDSARNDLVSFEVNESISNTLRGFADRIRMALA